MMIQARIVRMMTGRVLVMMAWMSGRSLRSRVLVIVCSGGWGYWWLRSLVAPFGCVVVGRFRLCALVGLVVDRLR